MAIKNIVFDFGNVIRKYDVEYMLSCFSLDEEEKRLFREKIFDSPLWANSDRGFGYRDVIFADTVSELPCRLRQIFYSLVAGYDFELKFMPEVEGIYEIISLLKSKGYGIYLLSNIGLNIHCIKNKLPVFRFFDGFLTSCDYGLLKPEKGIYEALFDRFGLLPEECLFIDDSPLNVEGSRACSMDAILFNAIDESAEALINKLREKGISISI